MQESSSSVWQKDLITSKIYQTAMTATIPPMRAKQTTEGNKITPKRKKESFVLKENKA